MVGFGWGNYFYNKTARFLEYLETKDQDSVSLKPNYVNIFCVDGWENSSIVYDIKRILRIRIVKL